MAAKLSETERAFLVKLFEDGVLGFGVARDTGVIDLARSLKAMKLVHAGPFGFVITNAGTAAAFA